MKTLGNEIIELLKKDQNFLRKIKKIAIDAADFKLAAKLREIEMTYFPLTEKEKIDIEEVEQFISMIRLLNLNCENHIAYRFIEAVKFKDKKDFSIKDAAIIVAKSRRLFGE